VNVIGGARQPDACTHSMRCCDLLYIWAGFKGCLPHQRWKGLASWRGCHLGSFATSPPARWRPLACMQAAIKGRATSATRHDTSMPTEQHQLRFSHIVILPNYSS
jgi:hypothetical protein